MDKLTRERLRTLHRDMSNLDLPLPTRTVAEQSFNSLVRHSLPSFLDYLEAREREIDNFLTFGQGGANFSESQLIAKLYDTESQLELAEERIRELTGMSLYESRGQYSE